MENSTTTSPMSVMDKVTAPYILKLKKVPHRFTTYIDQVDKTVLRFGAGISDNPDEEIIPNPDMVGSNLPGSPNYLNRTFDPSNFLKTKAFGLAPSNTTLTIKYSHGGSINDNVPAGDISTITSVNYAIAIPVGGASLVQNAKDSVAATNPNPATGGSSGETIREVRENALAYFQAQSRAVTREDYIVRTYSLPSKYGNIAKASLVQDDQLSETMGLGELDRPVTAQDVEDGKTIRALQVRIPNPLALNMYTLGYDSSKKLEPLNQTVKENLKTYLSQYRLVTDAVNIKDAYIINIAVNFAIITKVGVNKNDVLLRCVRTVQDFFDIDRWQIGQPIVLSDIAYELSLVEGVASLARPREGEDGQSIVITNKDKVSEGYSGNTYDVETSGGLIDGILYPALDPSIFEVKFPNTDIQGRVLGDNLQIV